eukprot:573833-Pleurochrysis_carterae.AAC.1
MAGGATHQGACLTPGGNTGSYDEEWGLSLVECRDLCAQRDICVAFEHAVLDSASPQTMRCELHKDPVTHVLPLAQTVCYMKESASAGPAHVWQPS